MSKLLPAMLLAVSMAGAPGLRAAEFVKDDRFPNNDQAKELLSEGVKEYRAGRYEAAAADFHNALHLEPDNWLLFQFAEAAGDGLLVQMEAKDELQDVLKDVLRRARIYQREMRHSPTYISLLMDKLGATEEEREVATLELVAVGPVAVPWLLQRMDDNRQDEMRTYCRIVLSKMGYRAVVALDEALKAKDQRTVESAALVLADIADPRSLPMLQALLLKKDASDTTKRVAANTVAAIAKASHMDTPPAADAGYFLEAVRYFRGGDRVEDEMVANESLMWKWDESLEGAKKLTFVRVPRYAWHDLMAEQLAYDGVGVNNNYTAFYPLLAADFAGEVEETDQRVRLAKEATTPPSFPDEDIAALTERSAALAEQGNRIQLFGGTHLYHAVQQAIVSERYDSAAYLMRTLEDRYLGTPDLALPGKDQGLDPTKPGSVLCVALDHPDKVVRYQAAITLAHQDPTVPFFNAEKVVPVLADALGEWGMRVVLVVDQDYRSLNAAREQLQKAGYMVYTASNGFECMQRLQETPIKDAIIISGQLVPTVTDDKGTVVDVPEQQTATLVDELKKDWRSAKTPIFIALPDDPAAANKIQAAFDGKVSGGFVKKPFSAEDLKGKIDIALKDADLPNINRENAEDISLRAAIALQIPDPARTQFDTTLAANALVGTLDKRADPLRIEACKALGLAAHAKNGGSLRHLVDRVTDVYNAQDAQLKPAVRAAMLYAIGQLDPSTDAAVAILLKALQFTDADAASQLAVRSQAAAAIGHQLGIKDPPLAQYLQQQRPDVRGPGAGKDPLDDITSGASKPAGMTDPNAKPADAPAPASGDAPAPAPAPPAGGDNK